MEDKIMTNKKLGRHLMAIRRNAGYDRTEIGKLCGVSKVTVKSYEFKGPSRKYVERFSKVIERLENE